MEARVYNPDEGINSFTFGGEVFHLVPNAVTVFTDDPGERNNPDPHVQYVLPEVLSRAGRIEDIGTHVVQVLGMWGVTTLGPCPVLPPEPTDADKRTHKEALDALRRDDAERIDAAEKKHHEAVREWAERIWLAYINKAAVHRGAGLSVAKHPDVVKAGTWLKRHKYLDKKTAEQHGL